MPKVIDLPTATSMDNGDYLIMEESSGGTKKITRSNALSHIGARVTEWNRSDISLPTSSLTTLCSVSISAGTWVFAGQVRIGGSGNFQMQMQISLDPSQTPVNDGGFVQVPCTTSTSAVSVNLSRIIGVSTQTTVYLVGWQNSGSSRSAGTGWCKLDAVRIA